MHEQDNQPSPEIPFEHIYTFANTLYSNLYYYFDMQASVVNTSRHFKNEIASLVLSVELTTYSFNNQIVNNALFGVSPRYIFEKVCDSYPDDDYFRKLYYVSAFIFHYVNWRYRLMQAVDIGMGPFKWIQLFRRKFESQFERHGGWQGFADAGEAMWEFFNVHRNDGVWTDIILPSTYIEGIESCMKLLPDSPQVSPDRLSAFFNRLSLQEDAPSDESGESEETEGSEEARELEQMRELEQARELEQTRELEQGRPEHVDEAQNPSPVALEENVLLEKTSEGTSEGTGDTPISPRKIVTPSKSRTNPRKRRHGPTAKDPDTEPDVEQVDVERKHLSVSPKRKKVQIIAPEKSEERIQKTSRKRRHESTAKDSGKEQDSPSSSKPKVDPE